MGTELTMSVQEEILRLEISVGDTFRVDELLHKQQELVRPEDSSHRSGSSRTTPERSWLKK